MLPTQCYSNHQKAEIPPAPPVQKTITLARSLVAIVLLWVTGIPQLTEYMVLLIWDVNDQDVGVTTLLAAVAFLTFISLNGQKLATLQVREDGNVPPIARTSLVLVLIE